MKIKYILYAVVILFVVMFTPNAVYSQCVACFQSPTSCSTEKVKEGGYSLGCGCMNGCKCYGEVCGDNSFSMMETMNINQFNDSVIDQLFNITPIEGLKVKLTEFALGQFDSIFKEAGFVDNESTQLAYFESRMGALRVSENEYILYRVENEQFTVTSCSGEIMFVAMKVY